MPIIQYEWTWVASGVKTCPDCVFRHGVSYRLAMWESLGLPGDGMTFCRDGCNCLLLRNDLLVSVATIETGLAGFATTGNALRAMGLEMPSLVMHGYEQRLLQGIGFGNLAELDYYSARIQLIDEIRAIEYIDFLESKGLYELVQIYENLPI